MKKHIIHHTKRAIGHVREKPYEVRMHIIKFLTALCGLIVVFLWIALLKRQLHPDPVLKKNDETTKDLIREQVVKVYSQPKDTNQPNQATSVTQ